MILRKEYGNQLNDIENKIKLLSEMCVEQMEMVCRCIVEKDGVLNRQIQESAYEIHRRYLEIADSCRRFLIQQQPVASDFKKSYAAIHLAEKYDHVSDYSVQLAELNRPFEKEAAVCCPIGALGDMAQDTLKMLKKTIQKNEQAARCLEESIEEENNAVCSECIYYLKQENDQQEYLLNILLSAKILMRIKVHCKTILYWQTMPESEAENQR